MERQYPNPKHLQGQGTQYKTSIEEKNVYTTSYDVLIPKMNIQGNHNSIRMFVLDVLPKIYKKVCEDAQNGKALRSEMLPLNVRVKLSAETTYSCDVCGKKYIRKPALKKHIQIKHTREHLSPQQAIISPSLPLPMPASMSSNMLPVLQDIFPHNRKSSSNLLEDNKYENNGTINLEETTVIQEETGPHHIDTNWQCGECGKVFGEENHLEEHMATTHAEKSWQCDECGETFPDEYQLTEHFKSIHASVTNTQCTECGKVSCDAKMLEDHVKDNHAENELMKELELLRRRHEVLKEKHEEAVKKNKEYARNLFQYIQENTELKNDAKKDAETLADTLSMNQVLVEELKVKDEIIKANEILLNENNRDNVTENVNVVNKSNRNSNKIQCNLCEWSSTKPSHLEGHMLKHTGQYMCGVCDKMFKTKNEAKEHEETHSNKFVCITCDKVFLSEHSFKQHMQSKHGNNDRARTSLPVGHPNRYQRKESVQNIPCTICSKVFATGKEVDDHMEFHKEENKTQQGFQSTWKEKICRYFRNGFCFKGEQCLFKHIEASGHQAPPCRRGQQCSFKARNMCKFFHSEQINQNSQEKRMKECKFQERCWNMVSCLYSHSTQQGFQFSRGHNRPPQGVTNMSAWLEY